jgi:hypothetical protein
MLGPRVAHPKHYADADAQVHQLLERRRQRDLEARRVGEVEPAEGEGRAVQHETIRRRVPPLGQHARDRRPPLIREAVEVN